MIFVTIMTWNTPIPKVIRSVSDGFLERFALNVNGLFSGSAPFLERNLVIIVFDSSPGFFCQIKTNKEHMDPVLCEQLNYVSVRFNFPDHCSHCMGSLSEPDRKSILYSLNIDLTLPDLSLFLLATLYGGGGGGGGVQWTSPY